MKVCMYCGASDEQPHGPFGCPADPETQKHLIEKFGPMAAIGDPYKETGPTLNSEVRPWGKFEILAENCTSSPFWKLKKITVNPNQALSLQSHKYRTEFWFVNRGSGMIINGMKDTYWAKNPRELSATGDIKMMVIPAEAVHRITAGPEGIEFLEFAFSITHPIDENDITRYEDRYGRA